MKRTPLRRRSKKKEKQDHEYYQLRKEYMEQHPWCEVCEAEGWPRTKATEIHHKGNERGVRRGSATNDVSTWLSVCSRCHHGRIHGGANDGFGPKWARERKYLI